MNLVIVHKEICFIFINLLFVAHLLLKKFEQQMSNKNVIKSNLRHQIPLITKIEIKKKYQLKH